MRGWPTTPGTVAGVRYAVGPADPVVPQPARAPAASSARATGALGATLALPGQPEQPNQRLRVVAVGDRLVEPLERPRHDFDPLLLVGLRPGLGEAGGRVDHDPLVREARAGVEARHLAPVLGRLADLLGQLASRRL